MTPPSAGRPSGLPEGRWLYDETRDRLTALSTRARKRLGQNFLVDVRVLDDILAAAELSPEDRVIEVGPGLGILTSELARRAGQVAAIELDDTLVDYLREKFRDQPHVRVIHSDILKADPAAVFEGEPYVVVANLPYYITSLALRHFLEASVRPRRLVLMVQKEVAERIVAKPGHLSLLAVSVQVYGRPSYVRTVPPQAFFPRPEVSSAIIRIDSYERPAVEVDNIDEFFRLVSAGFSQPRKQLHNSLGQRLWFPPGGAAALLEAAGIDPQRRAQALSLEEWEALYREWVKVRAA